MFPNFFKHKLSEVKSFFKGKRHEHNRDVDNVDDVEINYQKARQDAFPGFDPDTKRYQEDPQEKVLKESGGQDISAI
jgi:hypothetical protein